MGRPVAERTHKKRIELGRQSQESTRVCRWPRRARRRTDALLVLRERLASATGRRRELVEREIANLEAKLGLR